MTSRQLAAKELASKDFRRQLDGYGLTTAQILYRLPDHPSLLHEVSRPQPVSRLLAGDARGTVAFGHGRACPPDQADRNPLHRRRIPSALNLTRARRA